MYLNLLHRVFPGSEYPFILLQQEYAHELGLKVTLMVQIDAMQDPAIVADVKRFHEQYGDEIGLSLSMGYNSPEFREKIGGPSEFLWLYNTQEKRFIVQLGVDYFRKTFGHDPQSVASYHLDSTCQQILHEICPSVKIAVAGCFEEGVKVFHGCNNSWYLFNEGMPWGPWYPSKTHTLRPAENEADWTGIIGVPHLSRDLALSYEGRNDFFASHPANAQRGLANVGYKHPYDYNLCDLYRYQEDFNNGFSYYNVFVSAGWLAGHPTIQDPNEVSQKLYRDLLEYLAELRKQGNLTDMYMSEFADWYRQNWPIATPEVYLAKEVLYGSKKHYFWYLDPTMRVLVDTNQGGSIGDLRPYIGKTPVATGSDQKDLMFGSYPFVIQSIYRTGMQHHFLDGARTTLLVTHQGETLDMCTCQTRVAKVERNASGTRLILTPAKMTFSDGLDISIETEYRFIGGGAISITRRLLSISDPSATLTAREYLKGCFGVTEYPEDMRGITLKVDGDQPQALEYAYRRRELRSDHAKTVTAVIPQITTSVALEANTPAQSGYVLEGLLFSPYYTLAMDYELTPGKEISTWLSLNFAK
jgi:hypothetical protein